MRNARSNRRFVAMTVTNILVLYLLSDRCVGGQTFDQVIPFQGQLTTQSGDFLAAGADVTLVFRLYDQPVGGASFWEELHSNVGVTHGVFSVLLGSHSPLPGAKMFLKTVFLGITVDDGDPNTVDVEMRPRQALVPALSAVLAGDSVGLNGHGWNAILISGEDPSNSKIRADRIDTSALEERIAALEAAVQELRVPAPIVVSVGTVVAFGGDSEPIGWMKCDGRALSRTAFADLFAAIGTAHGSGDGATTFNIPDYRGRFLRGVSTDADGRDPDRNVRSAAQNGGNSGHMIGSVQDDSFRSHDHGGGNHYHTTGVQNGAAPDFGGIIVRREVPTPPYAANTSDSGSIIAPQGGNETRPVNANVYFIIRVRP